jgi:hypothetical protein
MQFSFLRFPLFSPTSSGSEGKSHAERNTWQ